MGKIEARPITEQFWILRKNNKKIGQVIQDNNKSYIVKINGTTASTFKTLKKLKEANVFEFIEMPKATQAVTDNVHEYPTDGLAYNPVWNLQYELPLFTPVENSKSWHAAGYYIINIKGNQVIHFCPKLITLQRNNYTGPYITEPTTSFDDLFE